MVSGFDCHVWQTLCVSFSISISHWNNDTLMRSSHFLKFPLSEAKCTVVTISHASHTRKSAGLILESSHISMGMTSKQICLSWGTYSKSKPKLLQKHIKWLNHHTIEDSSLKLLCGRHCGMVGWGIERVMTRSRAQWHEKQALTHQGRFCFVVVLQQKVTRRGKHDTEEGSKLEQHSKVTQVKTTSQDWSNILPPLQPCAHVQTHTHTDGLNHRSRQ